MLAVLCCMWKSNQPLGLLGDLVWFGCMVFWQPNQPITNVCKSTLEGWFFKQPCIRQMHKYSMANIAYYVCVDFPIGIASIEWKHPKFSHEAHFDVKGNSIGWGEFQAADVHLLQAPKQIGETFCCCMISQYRSWESHSHCCGYHTSCTARPPTHTHPLDLSHDLNSHVSVWEVPVIPTYPCGSAVLVIPTWPCGRYQRFPRGSARGTSGSHAGVWEVKRFPRGSVGGVSDPCVGAWVVQCGSNLRELPQDIAHNRIVGLRKSGAVLAVRFPRFPSGNLLMHLAAPTKWCLRITLVNERNLQTKIFGGESNKFSLWYCFYGTSNTSW